VSEKLPCGHDPGRDAAAGQGGAPMAVPGDAALDQIMALHDTPLLPAGLTARIMRDVPVRPQLAPAGLGVRLPAAPAQAAGGKIATGQVVALRLVGGNDPVRHRPAAARMSVWRGALLMLGGGGIGAAVASLAALALFGSPLVSTPQGGPAAVPSVPAGPAASAPAVASAAAAGLAVRAAAPGGGRAAPIALASAVPAPSILPQLNPAPPADAATPEADPVLPQALPATKQAAPLPDAGVEVAGSVPPALGTMGPSLPQGYGYSEESTGARGDASAERIP